MKSQHNAIYLIVVKTKHNALYAQMTMTINENAFIAKINENTFIANVVLGKSVNHTSAEFNLNEKMTNWAQGYHNVDKWGRSDDLCAPSSC